MASNRKQLIVDKRFQLKMSVQAIIFPLMTILSISAVLIYFTGVNKKLIHKNHKHIEEIIGNQTNIIEMFLATPLLQSSTNPSIMKGVVTFKKDIGILKKINKKSLIITENGNIIFYFLIIMTVVQTAIIFALFIFFSHKISGPIQVITRYLREIRSGNMPTMRSLRKRDELKDFYDEFRETITYIQDNYSKKDTTG